MDDYSDYKLFTIKCYFNSILNKNNPKINEYKNLILSSIKDINIIISLLYDYIKLKTIYDFNNNINSFNLDDRDDIYRFLIGLFNFNSINNILNNGKIKDDVKQQIIGYINFINNNKLYNNIPERNRTTPILKEVVENMLKNIKVNIQEHYSQHLLKFIKLFINNYEDNKENKLKFKSFIFNEKYNDKFINYNDLSDKLKQFYDNNKNIFVLEDYLNEDSNKKYKEKPLCYIIKIKPVYFLKSMYFINKSFEDYDNKIKEKINSSNNPNEKKKIKFFYY